ncbi:MAG: hypothetical protein AB7U95_03310 [Reyranella sp.]
MPKLHELQEARAAAVAAMRALSDKAETEKRDLTAAEDTELALAPMMPNGADDVVELVRGRGPIDVVVDRRRKRL